MTTELTATAFEARLRAAATDEQRVAYRSIFQAMIRSSA